MEKIDMVYLWCDGNEPAFRERKSKYQALEGRQLTEWQGGDNRFVDNDELKYSLRSLEKFAPWINHVYIVTDRQVPKWLNTEYDKVTVVDHAEIMSEELIPCFNSSVIEWFIHLIPNLAEKFLYANDDTFFGNKVFPEDFFAGAKPIVRVLKRGKYANISNFSHARAKVKRKNANNIFLINTYEAMYKKYQKQDPYILHHNIDAYIKSGFKETLEIYAEEFQRTYKNRFRNEDDLARIILGMDLVYRDKAVLEVIKEPNLLQKYLPCLFQYHWENYRGTEDAKTRKRVLEHKPKLFCVNARADGNIKEKALMQEFYQTYFPEKSHFEK